MRKLIFLSILLASIGCHSSVCLDEEAQYQKDEEEMDAYEECLRNTGARKDAFSYYPEKVDYCIRVTD